MTTEIEKELDVDLLMIVAALGAAILGLWDSNYYLIIDGAILIVYHNYVSSEKKYNQARKY